MKIILLISTLLFLTACGSVDQRIVYQTETVVATPDENLFLNSDGEIGCDKFPMPPAYESNYTQKDVIKYIAAIKEYYSNCDNKLKEIKNSINEAIEKFKKP